MTVIGNMQLVAAVIGIMCALIVLLFRRFGGASWLLSCFLLFSAAMPTLFFLVPFASPLFPESIFRLAMTSLMAASACGLLFIWSVDLSDYRQGLATRKGIVAGLLLALPVLVLLLFILKPTSDTLISAGFVSLGPGGYLSALYLLVVSVMALSSLEQIVRTVDESTKWEIKFLVLGLASIYAAIIYMASKALLYSFRSALLPTNAFHVFTLVFPFSCVLILVSWRRSTGRARITVSQSLIYSSITLLSVGVYLIASAILARQISTQGELGLQAEAAVFLLSLIILAAILMGTSFRHHVREWIRRNIFSGKYDYRQIWMEATERVRSVDGGENSAMALAGIIQRALGAIDVSVWLRLWNPDRLVFLAALGRGADFPEKEVSGIVAKFVPDAEIVSAEQIDKMPDNSALTKFSKATNAALLVPMSSSDRVVGLLTVGSNRSGRPYSWEAREFLHVLANHAGTEFHKHELLTTLVAAKETEAFKTFSTFLLHDLKNFASTLSLIANNAGRYQGNPDFQRDAFQSIFDTAEKMKRLCNNLRTFSSNLAANRKPDDLNRIVRAATASLNAGLSRNLKFELAELPLVCVDAEEVTRVLQNLLLNAREAISSEGFITIKTGQRDGHVELAVVDNGKGMTREFLQQELFLPFHTTKSDGLGIGLFQSKKIIEANRGQIYVESEVGQGTTVRIVFAGMT